MSDPITSTIAQLLFRGVPSLDFPNLVDDLRTSLMEGPTEALSVQPRRFLVWVRAAMSD